MEFKKPSPSDLLDDAREAVTAMELSIRPHDLATIVADAWHDPSHVGETELGAAFHRISRNWHLRRAYERCLVDVQGRRRGWFSRWPAFFAAIHISRTHECCEPSRSLAGLLYNARNLPQLPLKACDVKTGCRCAYSPATRLQVEELKAAGYRDA